MQANVCLGNAVISTLRVDLYLCIKQFYTKVALNVTDHKGYDMCCILLDQNKNFSPHVRISLAPIFSCCIQQIPQKLTCSAPLELATMSAIVDSSGHVTRMNLVHVLLKSVIIVRTQGGYTDMM